MSRPIPAGDYVEHFDPELPHHRAWLQAVLEQLVAHELDNRPDKTEFEFSKAIKLYNFIVHSPSLVLRLWQLRFQFAQRLLRIPIAMLFLPLSRVRPLKTIMNSRQVPLVTGSATNFFGWLDNSGTPFTSLVIVPGAGSPDAFATVDDLVLGQAAPASVPGPFVACVPASPPPALVPEQERLALALLLAVAARALVFVFVSGRRALAALGPGLCCRLRRRRPAPKG